MVGKSRLPIAAAGLADVAIEPAGLVVDEGFHGTAGAD